MSLMAHGPLIPSGGVFCCDVRPNLIIIEVTPNWRFGG